MIMSLLLSLLRSKTTTNQTLFLKWKLQTLPWADEDDDGNAVPMNSVVFVPTEYEKKNLLLFQSLNLSL